VVREQREEVAVGKTIARTVDQKLLEMKHGRPTRPVDVDRERERARKKAERRRRKR